MIKSRTGFMFLIFALNGCKTASTQGSAVASVNQVSSRSIHMGNADHFHLDIVPDQNQAGKATATFTTVKQGNGSIQSHFIMAPISLSCEKPEFVAHNTNADKDPMIWQCAQSTNGSNPVKAQVYSAGIKVSAAVNYANGTVNLTNDIYLDTSSGDAASLRIMLADQDAKTATGYFKAPKSSDETVFDCVKPDFQNGQSTTSWSCSSSDGTATVYWPNGGNVFKAQVKSSQGEYLLTE